MKRGIIQEEYNYGGGKMSDEETVRWEGGREEWKVGRTKEEKYKENVMKLVWRIIWINGTQI